jgi:hypothetical protein
MSRHLYALRTENTSQFSIDLASCFELLVALFFFPCKRNLNWYCNPMSISRSVSFTPDISWRSSLSGLQLRQLDHTVRCAIERMPATCIRVRPEGTVDVLWKNFTVVLFFLFCALYPLTFPTSILPHIFLSSVLFFRPLFIFYLPRCLHFFVPLFFLSF